jgi:aminopeptidase 2
MSTYLLAFANGEFEHLESSYKSPLSGKVRPLRIYGVLLSLSAGYGVDHYRPLATPDVINQAQYALDIKEKALPLYEQAFDIEYPLPKLDTLVVNDFDAGAMENWVKSHLL